MNNSDEFSCEQHDHHIKIRHASKTTNAITHCHLLWFANFKLHHDPALENVTQHSTLISLVHNWYIIGKYTSTKNEVLSIFYCPELQFVVKEVIDQDFPVDQFKQEMTHIIFTISFYRELSFAEKIKKYNFTIDKLKSLPGMTQNKLSLLYDNQTIFEDLIAHGLHISDFARINEKRLVYIIKNYDELKESLDFISVYEFTNIPQYSPSFFNLPQTQDNGVNRTQTNQVFKQNKCMLM